ncbi:quinone oxidoreductase family protein [Xanthobacter tagetidis]|jgi:NADPH2:quinone reductase|uniref:Quinone oxidoreductase n=1 Tax=Xanthobacter tagetidis TaxID=60216 RepID=A0A3L6ZUQ0_9HYPH|nr:quinone oxidoreductase [Xanthobacter tagetidis]MBB6309870.1 NADPH2:quinone reductase [Xanthobacter tagetidis]RLP71580.1 quinone oxidoreductase [Xanthobacter tagetidis]
MVHAVRVHQTGGPEVLTYEEITVPAPGPGEVQIRQTAIGLNFIDVYFRTGLYKAPQMPFVPGSEGAGVVEAVGPQVEGFHAGDRVAYAMAPGAYAEVRNIPAAMLVHLPAAIDDRTAAAMMLKGMTAQYLVKRTHHVKPGDVILVQAAAGGVGLILTQWAHQLGATVIGTVGSKDKAELALAHGCDHVILYRDEDFVHKVKEITAGKLCDVVYDGIGQATYPASLDCLRPLGLWVSFGNASGAIRNFDLLELSKRGSLFATRPTLATFVAKRHDLLATANDLFEAVLGGGVKIPVHQTFALKDARKAHEVLEGRGTTGSTLLLP